MNVLILDDNQSGLSQTCDLIKDIPDIHLIGKTEADDLNKVLGENIFDIVITDILVGFVSIEQILSVTQKFPRMSLIVLSDKLSEDEATNLLSQGVNDYLSKQYISRLRHIVQRSYTELNTKRNLDEAISRLNKNITSKSTLIENIPGVVYRCAYKNNWKPEFMSEQCEIVTGYPFNYLSEHGYEYIIHHQDIAEVHRLIDSAVSGKTNFELNYRIFTRDGSVRYMWERGKGIFDSHGNIEALEGVIMDVTTNKIREQLIQQFNETVNIEAGEKFFSKLTEFLFENFESKLIIVGRYVEEGSCIQTVSRRDSGKEIENINYPLEGSPCNKVLSKKLCLYKENVQSLFPDAKNLAELNAESYIGVPVFNSKGILEGLIVLIDTKPILNVEPKELVLSFVATRVGNELENLLSKHKIAQSEAKLKAVIENQSELIVRWSLTGKILFANELFLKHHALTEDKLSKLSYTDLIKDKVRIEQKIKKLTLRSSASKDVHQSLDSNGKLKWHEWHDAATFDQEGNITEIQSIGRDVTKQKEDELAIYREKEKFKKYLDTTPTIVLLLDTNGNIELMNSIGCQILQCKVDEILNKNWFDNFIPSSESLHEKNIYLSNIKNDVAPQYHKDSWVHTKSGKDVLISWYNSAICDHNGKITGVLSSGIDITERRKSQNQLAENESLLKKAQRITRTGSFFIIPGDPVRKWSDEMYNIFEVSPDSFIPTLEAIMVLVLDEDKYLLVNMQNSLLAGNEMSDIEYRIRTSAGKVKYLQGFGEIIRDDSGTVVKIIGTTQDITQSKLAEISIKEKDAFSEGIFAAIHDSIVVIDKEGKIIKSNQQWKNFAEANNGVLGKLDLGVNYLDVCRKSLKSGDELAGFVLDGIISVLSSKEKLFEIEYPCHSATARRWFSLKVTPFGSNLGGAVLMHTDISEKRKKDEELQNSINEIYVAEEINNALLENKSFTELGQTFLTGLEMLMNNSRGRFYKYNPDSTSLNLIAERIAPALRMNLEKKAKANLSNIIPELKSGSIFRKVIDEKRVYFTSDKKEIIQLISEHTSNPLLKMLARWAYKAVDIRTFGLLPLVDKNKILGLITFSVGTKLTEVETQMMVRFSNHVSTILGKKIAEQELILSEEKFKAISNYTANWETWIDVNGIPKWINPGVEKLSGFTAEELLAMPDFYNQVIYIEDLPRVMSTLQKGLEEKTEGENLEFRINHRNGSKPWFSVSWKQVYGADGNWLGIRSSGLEITERKNYESALITKQLELGEAHEIARLGSWNWNTATESITFSESLSQMLGFDRSSISMTKEKLMNLIHPESRERIDLAIFNATADFKSKEIEVRISLPDGGEKYILIRATLSSADHATQPAVKGTALDITELKQSHNKSKEAEARFEKIFNSIQDVYYQTDLTGHIIMVSPSVYDMLGYKPEELIGESVSMLFVKPKMQELKLARTHLLGNSEQFETAISAKNGEAVSVSVKLNFLTSENGKRFAVQGMMRNISEKKKQEISLENQRKRLLEIVKLNTQIIQTSQHFYYVIEIKEKNYHFKYVSAKISEVLGLTELEILRSTELWTALIHPDDIDLHKSAITKLRSEKKPQRVSYRIINKKTSQVIWIDDYICPLLNDEQEIIEIYGSAMDSTERISALLNIEAEKMQTMAYQYQLLSSQLNPHFIYNTLNSFQYYILQGQVETSLNHISDFSQLMRKVLENSMYKYITVEDEINFLYQYVRISKERMKTELQFEINIQEDFDASDFMIPPMLLQPYIENAIVHGFVDFEGEAKLNVHFEFDDHDLKCTITDNGIGRKKSVEHKEKSGQPKRKSFAIGINESRINLLNQITKGNFKVLISDLYHDSGKAAGTKVEITFNILVSDLD